MNEPKRRIFTWRRFLVGVLVLLLITPVVLISVISSSDPLVLEVGTLNTNSSVQAKKLAKRLKKQVLASTSLEEFTATEDELNGLIQLAMRGVPRLKGRVNVAPIGIESAFSFHVPENPFGNYINVQVGLIPSNNGLVFSHASIGGIDFSGDTTLTLLEIMLNLVLSNNQGTMLIEAIQSTNINENQFNVLFRPIPDLKARLNASKERFKALRDNLELLGKPDVVKVYYEKLCEVDSQHVGNLKVSLAWYMAPVFELAKKRVETGNDVVAENRAAILAMGIFLGSDRIEGLIGSIRSDKFPDCKNGPRYVVLANRLDLRLHFIISAVLKVISDSGMSSAVGEFKELLDSAKGGSGFSFVDLSADKAGLKLAESLLDNTGIGLQTLTTLAETTDEQIFFPSIEGLKEGIRQENFEQEYGDINDERYLAMVTEIRNRISALPLYIN